MSGESGKEAALLPPPPLRTGLESFPSSGSSRRKPHRKGEAGFQGDLFTVASGRCHAEPLEESADQVAAERAARKFGVEAYPLPTTRDGHEETLYALAADIADPCQRNAPGGDLLSEPSAARCQLEAQFDRLADSISLARTKRRYIRATATRRRAGEPMPRPAQIAGGPMEEALYSVPKAQDFDPDPITRAKRWPRPAHDYNTRAEVQSSLNAALQKLAKKPHHPQEAKAEWSGLRPRAGSSLHAGNTSRPSAPRATLPTSPTAPDTATDAVAPIQSTAPGARPVQMLLF